MLNDPFLFDFEKILICAFLLIAGLALIHFLLTGEDNQQHFHFEPGDRAFSTFNADIVLIQEKSGFGEKTLYKVLYKAKDGALLSVELPASDLEKISPDSMETAQNAAHSKLNKP